MSNFTRIVKTEVKSENFFWKMSFYEIWHSFSQALVRNFLWCHYRYQITFTALACVASVSVRLSFRFISRVAETGLSFSETRPNGNACHAGYYSPWKTNLWMKLPTIPPWLAGKIGKYRPLSEPIRLQDSARSQAWKKISQGAFSPWFLSKIGNFFILSF